MTCKKLNYYTRDLFNKPMTRKRHSNILHKQGTVGEENIRLACGLQALEDLINGKIKNIEF